MEGVKTPYFCTDQAIAVGVVPTYYPIATTQGPTNLGAWKWGTVLVDLTIGAPGSFVTLTLEISHDGVTWFPVLIHATAALGDKWVLALNVGLVATGQSSPIGISIPAPYIRLGAFSTGDATTLTAVFVAIT